MTLSHQLEMTDYFLDCEIEYSWQIPNDQNNWFHYIQKKTKCELNEGYCLSIDKNKFDWLNKQEPSNEERNYVCN